MAQVIEFVSLMMKMICVCRNFSKIEEVRNEVAKNNIEKVFSDTEKLINCLDNTAIYDRWRIQKRRWNENKLREEGHV
jgi:hypothetical protein